MQADWVRGGAQAPPVIQPTAEEAARKARLAASLERLSAISGVPMDSLTALRGDKFTRQLYAAVEAPAEPLTLQQAVAVAEAAAARYSKEGAAAAREHGVSGDSAGAAPTPAPGAGTTPSAAESPPFAAHPAVAMVPAGEAAAAAIEAPPAAPPTANRKAAAGGGRPKLRKLLASGQGGGSGRPKPKNTGMRIS